jgi:hypothetical protein
MADQNIKVKIDLDIAEFNKQAKALSNAISNVLGKDVDIFNGKIKQTAKDTDKATEAFGRAGAAAGKAGTNVKKSNQQWSNFALIIQDLPYGFRGIQNNLPAVIGSFAGMTGPLYLATSAIIAFFTALDSGLISFGKSTKQAEDFTKQFGTTLTQETIKYQSLYRVATDVNTSMNERIKAAAALKKEYPGLLDKYSEEEIALGKAKVAFDKLSISIIKYAKAQAAIAVVTDLTKEQLLIEGKRAELLDKFVKDPLTNYSKAERLNMKGASPYNVALNYRVNILKQLATQYNDLQKKIDVYTKVLDKNATAEEDLNKFKNEVDTKKIKGKTAEQIAEERLKAIENANNAEIKAYTESLDERDKKEYEAGLKLAENLQIMRKAGYTDSTTYYTAYRAEMDKIATYYNNKEIEEARKTAEQIAREAEIIDNRQLQNSLDSLKIQSDVAMKIANLSGNANAADRIKILEEYKAGLYDLASVGGYTAEQFDKIDDAIKRVDAAIDGSKDKVKDFSITWQETSNAINGILNDLVKETITKFAENIGKSLAGEGTNPFEGFGLMIADAAIGIGKALIAYGVAITAFAFAVSNPFAAIAAGAALVIAGSYLKSRLSKQSQAAKPTAFADGGIISGPTMGLMGEYPGASHNPEVVAPLDKLKSLIGGSGGGTLEARISGNDLLILMNKAGRTNNNTF